MTPQRPICRTFPLGNFNYERSQEHKLKREKIVYKRSDRIAEIRVMASCLAYWVSSLQQTVSLADYEVVTTCVSVVVKTPILYIYVQV